MRNHDVVQTGGVGGQMQAPSGGAGGNDFGNATAGTTMLPPPTGGAPVMNDPPPSTLDPISIDACGADNAAGLSVEDAQKLVAGSGSAGAMRVLYPYDGTVFPRGLLAPLIMWEGAEADAVYVHLVSGLFEYRGCLAPTAPGQLQLPQDVWEQAGTRARGASDPFTLELSVLKSGAVVGPATQQLTVAQATIKGSIYYNSYSSALGSGGGMLGGGFGFPGGGGGNGIVLRIRPGAMAEAFTDVECNGCHSVSANGERLLSATPGLGAKSFALTPDIAPNPPSMNAGPKGAFGGLFPDGSLYLAQSTATSVGRSALVADPTAPIDAALYRTDDGSVVPNTGIPTGALMPTFSASGRVLAFTDNAISGSLGGGHGIAVMDFDVSNNTATNYRELYTDTQYRPGWPFTLPDDRAVVFVRTDGPDFSGDGAGLFPGTRGPFSDLYIADIASNTVTVLAQAMGYRTPEDAASDRSYLPGGADDLHGNYFPTISPVSGGGYFWVFFDSLRSYGNLGVQRQLWGAAIDVSADGNYARDPSHPAFYLPGQELGTGNHRAFAALDPCKMDGDTCRSGTDCCGGFCYLPEQPEEFEIDLEGKCDSTVHECSHLNERCTTAADCCPTTAEQRRLLCIAGFCAVPVVE